MLIRSYLHLLTIVTALLSLPTQGNEGGDNRELTTGTCGNGNYGNGICSSDPNMCCSVWGFCGTSALHCEPHTGGTCGNGNLGNGFCPLESHCCSYAGYCTISSTCPQLFHNGTCGSGKVRNGLCISSAHCCSKWGHCGTGQNYCSNSNRAVMTFTPPPTPPPVTPAPVTPAPQDGGANSDPIILGLQNQVFKFIGQSDSWYANLANKYFQWNMQFRDFESCPVNESMFISGISISMFGDDDSDILIATTPEAIPECRNDPKRVCLGEGTLHISLDGGETYISEAGDYHSGLSTRVVAHNTYAACSRKWHDYDVSDAKNLRRLAAANKSQNRRRMAIQEKQPLQLLRENKAKMIDPEDCDDWIDERSKNNDLFQQKGQWSTLYIETELVSFHIEYRRSDFYDRQCDFQALDAWMTKVSSTVETEQWSGILGETKYKVYDKTTGDQIKSDRDQLLRGKDDADYEVDGPFGRKFAAATSSASESESVLKKMASSLLEATTLLSK